MTKIVALTRRLIETALETLHVAEVVDPGTHYVTTGDPQDKDALLCTELRVLCRRIPRTLSHEELEPIVERYEDEDGDVYWTLKFWDHEEEYWEYEEENEDGAAEVVSQMLTWYEDRGTKVVRKEDEPS